jgi:hypothetical protein
MNAQHSTMTTREPDTEFSPVENEPPLRWQRILHLAPAGGLGVGRRAVFYALLAWMPIALWAAATGNLWNDANGERLLQHYGINVRCLIAIPLFILAEAALHNATLRIVPQFLQGGLVAPAEHERFERLLADMRRLRNMSLPWILLLGGALAWSLADQPERHADAMAWAYDADGGLGFGGLWYAYVARPLFLALLLGWLWRFVLIGLLFARIGRLKLSLVPTHPDRVAGLGFLETLPGAFGLVSFAMSAVLASQWAHEILHHGTTLDSLKLPIIAFVVIWSVLLLLPLLALAPPLAACKRNALAEYSVLVGEQGRLVHRRWILREKVEPVPLLDAPEIGPVVDANAIYEAVKAMRPMPIGKRSITGILIPLALPLLAMAALQIPLKALLLKIAKTLL